MGKVPKSGCKNSYKIIIKLNKVYPLSGSMKVGNFDIALLINKIPRREGGNHVWVGSHFMGNVPKSAPQDHGQYAEQYS